VNKLYPMPGHYDDKYVRSCFTKTQFLDHLSNVESYISTHSLYRTTVMVLDHHNNASGTVSRCIQSAILDRAYLAYLFITSLGNVMNFQLTIHSTNDQ